MVVADLPLKRFRRGDFGLFLPKVFSTEEGLNLLGKVYPQMSWDTQSIIQDQEVENTNRDGNPVRLFGWMLTERTINAPHTNTNEASAEKATKGRMGLTLNVYAEAGNQSWFLTGRYLDQTSTCVRILNSRVRGWVVDAGFGPDGYCGVDGGLRPGDAYPFLGVRYVGV